MKATLRYLAKAACAAAAIYLTGVSPALSQDKTIRLIVPFAPGGGVDVVTRLAADNLRQQWPDRQVIVENKPGGNTIIGVQSLLSAPKDGSNFLVTISSTLLLPHLMADLSFDPSTDLVPVSPLTSEQMVVVTSSTSGIKTLHDFVEQAKRPDAKLSYGSYATGSISHLLYHELDKMSGGGIVHIPYKGVAPTSLAVLSNEVTAGMTNLVPVRQHIESGKLIALAVTGPARSPYLPNVPTISEQGIKGFESPSWIGVFAARGVPDDVLQTVGQSFLAASRSPELVAKMKDLGADAGTMDVAEFVEVVRRDKQNLGKKIDDAGIRLK